MTTDQGTDISGMGLDDQGASGNNGGNPGGSGSSGSAGDDAAAKAKADADAKAIADAKTAADKKIADDAAAKKAADDKAALEAKNKGTGTGGDEPPVAVELDGVKYPLDKDGNALDKDGKVFKTKAELDQLEEGQEEPLVDAIINRAGVKLLDDKGQPKKYEDTEDGVVAATIDIGKEFAKGEYQKLLDSDPEFKEFVEYKKTGGTLNDFIQKKTESWGSFKLDENNETQLTNVIMSDLMAAGVSEEQAKRTAELYKESKTLKEFGKAAYTRLVDNEKREEAERVKQFQVEQATYVENTKKHWDSVKEIITKGTINNLVIPEADKEAFFDYISKAVDDKGNSKRNVERSKLPLERLLQLDYFQYKGFDLNELVKTAVKTEKVRSLRKRISTNRGVGGGEGLDKNNYHQPGNLDGISMDNLEVAK